MLTSIRWEDQVLDDSEVAHVDEEGPCDEFQFGKVPRHAMSDAELADTPPTIKLYLDKRFLLWRLGAETFGPHCLGRNEAGSQPRDVLIQAALKERESSCH
jgi:hypothetical protein